jgi:hypothetical protein
MQRPVFIGSAGRSGSTLLADMLGFHSLISPVYETNFVIRVSMALLGGQPPEVSHPKVREIMDQWTRPLPLRPHQKRAYERYHHGPHYILFDRPFAMEQTGVLLERARAEHPVPALRGFFRALFAEHARRDHKPLWVNKMPQYIGVLPLLRGLYPDMLFVHCVRDGRDVSCSLLTRDWGPKDHDEGVQYWSRCVSAALDFQRRYPDQYVEVRYEDLMENPTLAMRRVIVAMGLRGAEKLVQDYQAAGFSFETGRAEGWRQKMDAGDQAHFALRAGGLLRHFGYPAEVPEEQAGLQAS